MQERRKVERKILVAYTQVFDLYGGSLLGYLGDLTVIGAMVISERAYPVEYELTLAIELPELTGIQPVQLNLKARSVWCNQDLSPQYYNIGFEFLEISEAQKEVVEAIVKVYEFRRDMPSSI
ncbi:MAG: PilZ domain-containing protein [Anaerolineales bacterium]|nr:PilZ domain-containing protein [Anaerolineales bacterium]